MYVTITMENGDVVKLLDIELSDSFKGFPELPNNDENNESFSMRFNCNNKDW